MRTFVAQTVAFTVRELRPVARQPIYILFSLVQPLVWLVLFGQLFRGIANLPAFAGGDYLTFMIPGIMAMTAIFGSSWLGTGFIQDMNRGVMNRFLVAPARRGAILLAKTTQNGIILLIQMLVVLGIGLLMGAQYPGGPSGVLLALLAAAALTTGFGMFSNLLALLFGRQESLIAVSNFLLLPMTFLSSALMPSAMMPDWMLTVARFNPVEWAASAVRQGLGAAPDRGVILVDLGLLTLFAAALAACATLAFRSYQRSV